MFDFSHLPNTANGADIQVLRAPGQFQTWTKPRGKSRIEILAIGSGAGGGGGFSGASATARGGGGGGGAAGFANISMPASAVPDILYCFVASGGLGGNPGVVGVAGANSFVSTRPFFGPAINVLTSHNAGPGGGGAGTAAAAGAAGTGATVISRYPLSGAGSFDSTGGLNGSAGGAQTGAAGAATSITYIVNGGAGGAGVGTANANFAGGALAGNEWVPALAGGLAGGGRGNDGFEISTGGILMPLTLVSAAGTGGGSNGTGTGGDGGNGGLGSGGGGGGAGVTGGRGGNGGHGAVIIMSW